MHGEIWQIKCKRVMKLVTAPEGCEPVKTGWLCLKNVDSSNMLSRHRAMLVA